VPESPAGSGLVRRIHFLVLISVFAVGSLVDCDCNDTIFKCPPDRICTSVDDCDPGIDCSEGCCGGAVVWDCTADVDCDQAAGECCKDHKCTTDDCPEPCVNPCGRDSDCEDVGVCMACVDKCCTSFACESDDDCPPDGDLPRYCAEFDPDLGCRNCDYVRCKTDEECEDPSFALYVECTEEDYLPKCKQGTCVCSHPCGAPCQEPLYCCKATRTCDPLPDPCPDTTCPACEQINSDPGGTLDDDNCVISGADCHCEPMPPLPDAFAGQHSAIALDRDGIPVLSGYFGRPYGDLIFGVAASAEAGATVSWRFIDGVPPDAPCVGAADGPRGGIAEPGDDVGWDTDIVTGNGGRARISYFDRTNGALKYAAEQADGSFLVHTVDDAGITGRFSSIVLDSAGRPVVAYMTVKEDLTSMLKVARAKNPSPASNADWDIYIADAAPVPCQPSDCDAGEACLADTGACVVPDDPANCNGGDGCAADKVCVAGECQTEASESSLEDLPLGVGVFCNLALYADGSPVVGYYDSLRGNLMLVWWNPGANDFDPPVILAGEDAGGNDLGNLGADVSMFVTVPGNVVHLSYQDADLGDLYYMTFPDKQVASAQVELIDLGARDASGDPTDAAGAVGDLHWVGNYASITVDAAGDVRVAYQDGYTTDLDYAIRNGAGVWSVEIIARKLDENAFVGAYGFFTDQIMNQAGDLAQVSNFKHNLRTDPWTSAIDLRVR